MQDQIQGDVSDGIGPAADEFRRNFTDRNQLGAALTVVRAGNVVVDLWGGHRDKKRSQPWEQDTAERLLGVHGRGAIHALAHERDLGLQQPPPQRGGPR